MINVYLDTNVFIFAFEKEKSNSKRILDLAILNAFTSTISYHSFDELKKFFSKKYSKNTANNIVHSIKKIPNLKIVEVDHIDEIKDKHTNLVSDIDDLPHICACVLGKCDFFVTTNRRLTQMKAKNKVKFLSPKQFLEKLNLTSLNTKNEE